MDGCVTCIVRCGSKNFYDDVSLKEIAPHAQNKYTECSIRCHMVCYVTMVPFLATILLDKFTSIVMDD